ncbi:MAG: paraquat-inducible protein A [Pseudomonadota bacterium]
MRVSPILRRLGRQIARTRAPKRRIAAANCALLVAYPVAWAAPLAHAGLLPWFRGNEITILGGVRDLWTVDPALSLLVALFAMVIPFGKTAALAAIHLGALGTRALPVIETIGKLSMADVFLIAVYIVVVKGVGLGSVVTGWGLWLFTACVLGQIWISHATKRHDWRRKTEEGETVTWD